MNLGPKTEAALKTYNDLQAIVDAEYPEEGKPLMVQLSKAQKEADAQNVRLETDDAALKPWRDATKEVEKALEARQVFDKIRSKRDNAWHEAIQCFKEEHLGLKKTTSFEKHASAEKYQIGSADGFLEDKR